MDDIARHSGVSKGALYLHFESKEQLYLNLALRALRDLLKRLEALPREGTGFQRLRAMLETYAQFSVSDPARFRLAGAWMSHDWHFQKPEPLAVEYTEVIKQALGLAVEAFELGKQDGSVQPHLDTQLTILQTIAGIHGVSDLYVRMLADAEQVAPQLDQRLWGKILPSRAETSVPQTRESIVLSHVELLLAAMQRK
jgi:AcrR family transcriptional regulator